MVFGRIPGIAAFYTRFSSITVLCTNRNCLIRENGSSDSVDDATFLEQLQVNGTTANQNEVHATAMRDIFGSGCFELYVDVQPVLGALKRRGLAIGRGSNWHRGLHSFCHETNLSHLPDAVISSSDLGIEKPDPRIFDEVVRQLHVKPDQIVHVGDSPDDDFAGSRSGWVEGNLDRPWKPVLLTSRNRINNLYELEGRLQSLGEVWISYSFFHLLDKRGLPVRLNRPKMVLPGKANQASEKKPGFTTVAAKNHKHEIRGGLSRLCVL